MHSVRLYLYIYKVPTAEEKKTRVPIYVKNQEIPR